MNFRKANFIAIALLAVVSVGAQAATPTEKEIKAHYKAAVAQANADYKVADRACNKMTGNDKDVCQQQAKATRDKAKADAKAARTSRDAMADAHEDKMTADYKVAKEKCDALSGKAKDACVADAKATYHQ